MRGGQPAIASIGIAGPYLVSLRAREMKCNAASVWTDAEPIGQSFASLGEFARIRSVEPHVENLANLVAHNLHQHSLVVDQRLGCVKDRQPVLAGNFVQGFLLKIVNPKMCRRLRVIFLEWAPGTVAAGLHAQEDDSPAIRKEWPRLPGGLIGDIELECLKAGAIRMDQTGLSRRSEKQTLRFPSAQMRAAGSCRQQRSDKFPPSHEPVLTGLIKRSSLIEVDAGRFEALNSPVTPPLLTMRDIHKAFPGLKALNGVNLTLRAGEIHALMGENGAGKSTLIKTLTGVYAADSGTIELDGKAIHPRSTREAEACGISTVYQEVNLIPTLTIADNILLGRQPTRFGLLRKNEMEERAAAALERLGLKLDIRRHLGSLSMAEQQLVAIARALDVQAKILILDEPTSSLDEREVEFLFGIMRRLKEQGMALLFVTHFMDQVYAVSDRITVLRNGALVGEYLVSELPRLKLISAMIGRELEDLARTGEKKSQLDRARNPFLTARQIGRKGVMNALDLEIGEGEVVSLAGLLGSGRTETAKMLFGVVPPDTGEIQIEKQPASVRSPRQAVRKGLAFCTEDRKTEGIIPNLSVRENMILAMQASCGPLKLLSRAEQFRIADEYIRALNIKTPSPETPICNLSGGNQQKVLLARWLCMAPRLFILDEPTRGIDVGAKAEIEKLVNTLREKGMAVLFISSELEEALRVSQRVVVLRDRKKIGELPGGATEHEVMDLIARSE